MYLSNLIVKKKDKKFKTDLMTSFILLLLLCQFLFNSKLKYNNKKNNTSTLQSLSDSNVIRTHNHLVHKQTIEWGFTQKLVRDMRVFKSLFKKKASKNYQISNSKLMRSSSYKHYFWQSPPLLSQIIYFSVTVVFDYRKVLTFISK